MRVLFLADRLSDRGGADCHLLEILRELGARGVEVKLAAGELGEVAAPCPAQRLPGLASRGRQELPLQALLDEARPDLVHLQNVMNPAVLEGVASGSVPAVITVQDHRVFCPGRGKWTARGEVCREPMSRARCAGCFDEPGYFEAVYRLTEERLAAVRRLRCVVLSRYMRDELVSVGVPEERLHRIPPIVARFEEAAAPPAEPCVLFAGRLVAAKGVADAVEIWRRARTGLPLAIAGVGPERGRLPSLPGLQLLGWVPHPQLGAQLSRARALLLPSRWQEPYGIVGAEARSLAVPVVAWRSGGVEDWHPGPLCAFGDLDAMAGMLREAVERRGGPPMSADVGELMEKLLEVYRVAITA